LQTFFIKTLLFLHNPTLPVETCRHTTLFKYRNKKEKINRPDKINEDVIRLYNVYNLKHQPMPNSTSEELKPSEKTLNLIRQIAYTYRTFMTEAGTRSYCLN
jgi:hypothetical protein